MTRILGVQITNPEKTMDNDIKKIDVVNYYKKISHLILPFLNFRAISEVRCHEGFSDCFFKKHPNGEVKDQIFISEKMELIEEVQMGTIEFHPEGLPINSDGMTIMVFDLDPDEKMKLNDLRDGVMKLKEVLDELSIKSFLKTSGGKGYHVVIPFKNSYNAKKFESFAKMIALLIEEKYPKMFTTNMRKTERSGKIFVDYLRNKKGATCVAPYSLRARKNLPISFPLLWEDLENISPSQITIKNVSNFLKRNPWRGFFKVKQELR